MTQDQDLQTRIADLIAQEHQLRQLRDAGGLGEADEHERLRAAEIELDQCWDLLRQRRAKRDFGQDAAAAVVRSPGVVENYWQ